MQPPYLLNAGDLRHTCVISSVATIQDASGQPVSGDWTPVITTRCSIRNISGRETDQTSQLASQTTYKVRVRWFPAPSIAPGMRVAVAGSLTLQIQYADNVQLRNRCLELTCIGIDEAA